MPENYHLPSTRPLSGLAFPVDEFLRDYQPSTELVRSIHSQEASSGVGTYQQLEDYYNKEINDGKPLSKEDWKNSEYYRDGLEYYDGMTDTSANILARRHDTDALSSFVRERSSYGQALYGFFFGGIPGSFQDPLNLGLMFVPPVGEAKVMKMLGISSGIKRMVAEGAYRGAITNAYFEPMSYIASSGLQQDYGVGNTISNIALGGFVGAGLHTSEKFIGSKLSEKIRTEYKLSLIHI